MRPTPAIRRTIVLVLDGLRPDAIDAFELPHLQRLRRRSAYTMSATTIAPSVTWPAMTSLASRLAIVAAFAPSSREVLGSDGGILVPPPDPSAFANAILDLVRDPGSRECIANRAAARARTFSWDRIFDDLLADYRRVIAASRATRVPARRL